MGAWRGDVEGVVGMTGERGMMAVGGTRDGDLAEGGTGVGEGEGATEVVERAGRGGCGVELRRRCRGY